MIAVDTNVLVYAHRRESRHHREAADVVRRLAEGSGSWAIPWPCIYEYFSVATNPRIWRDNPTTPGQAWRQVEAWTSSPTLSLIGETPDFTSILATLLQHPRVRGPIVHDARIVAICLAHGVEEFLTADRDFTLWPRLRARNPFLA